MVIILRKRVEKIKLSPRQEEIIKLVKANEPITSENLAGKLNLTRAALRPDLAILTMTGILEARPKVGYIVSKKPSYSLLQEYIRNIKVQDIMSKPIVVSDASTVYDSIMHLFLNDVGTLFIENSGFLVGAVSRKDFLKIAIGGTDMHKMPVGIIMTRMPNIVLVSKEDSAYLAAEKIIEHEVDSLPVVEKMIENGKEAYKIIGKVSKTNITRLFVKMSEQHEMSYSL
jgi:CBS domain-containing protein